MANIAREQEFRDCDTVAFQPSQAEATFTLIASVCPDRILNDLNLF